MSDRGEFDIPYAHPEEEDGWTIELLDNVIIEILDDFIKHKGTNIESILRAQNDEINFGMTNSVDLSDLADSIKNGTKPTKKTKPKGANPHKEARKEKLRSRYHQLTTTDGLKSKIAIDRLTEEFPEWARSTIETYLKR